jgi:hypothetical protein
MPAADPARASRSKSNFRSIDAYGWLRTPVENCGFLTQGPEEVTIGNDVKGLGIFLLSFL